MTSHVWLFYAFGAAIIWGFSYVIAEKLLKGGISPLQLFALEGFISFPILLLLAEIWGGGLKQGAETILQSKTLLLYFFLGTFCFITASICIFTSVAQKNATMSSIIEISYPLFTVFFAWLLFREFNLNWATGAGALLIMAGTLLIIYKS
jgi:drug/metabolite transporter (DMT)-like permease